MAFAGFFPTIPENSDSYDLGTEPGQKNIPKSTQYARHAWQHEGYENVSSPSPSPQRSPQSSLDPTVSHDEHMGTGASPLSRFPASKHIPNTSHDIRSLHDSPYCINDNRSYSPSSSKPSSNQLPRIPPPLTDDNLLGSLTSTVSPSSNSKSYFDLSSIFKLKRLNPAVVFQNSGSVARDHLASERTFLAYVRTSLALASAGVGIVQLFAIAELTSKSTRIPLALPEVHGRLQALAMPLGTMTLLFSLMVLFMGGC